MKDDLNQETKHTPSKIIPLSRFLEAIGIHPATAWKWRTQGWLKTINIAGRVYIHEDAIRNFEERAARGDFAQVHQTPQRQSPINSTPREP